MYVKYVENVEEQKADILCKGNIEIELSQERLV